MGMILTRECSRSDPSERRWFGARQERGRGFELGERRQSLEEAQIGRDRDGSRLSARGFRFPCPLQRRAENRALGFWISVHEGDMGFGVVVACRSVWFPEIVVFVDWMKSTVDVKEKIFVLRVEREFSVRDWCVWKTLNLHMVVWFLGK